MKMDVICPIDGRELDAVDAVSPSAVPAIVAAARGAGEWWAGIGADERKMRLMAWARKIATGLEDVAQLIHEDMGKPYDDARTEIVGALNLVLWAISNADRVLGDREVPVGPGLEGIKAFVRYRPYGVVGVIGPWNFPVMTPVGIFAFALAAGNAVVFKPSEFTPRAALWLAQAFSEVVPEQPVLQVINGRGDVGRALVAAKPDKVAFTGSHEVGRAVYEQCASLMIPALLELGGKNALIVADDADIDAAVRSAVYGAFQNSGQACIGISRLIVLDSVYDELVPKLREAAGRIQASRDGDLGPIVTDRQLVALAAHIADALDKGATLLLDGRPTQGSRFASPTILENVPEDALICREETFAPALIVLRAATMDEAVKIANGTAYGLGGSVFSRDHGTAIADRLRSGMTAINAAAAFAFVPGLPFGGVGDSGFGRKHGDEGLREFARPHSIAIVSPGQGREGFGRPSQVVDSMVSGIRAALGVGA